MGPLRPPEVDAPVIRTYQLWSKHGLVWGFCTGLENVEIRDRPSGGG
jgi:hypothetical protein